MRPAYIIILAAGLLLSGAGCEKASPVPPPPGAVAVMESVKDGYNREDTAAFCRHFTEEMYSGGFTREKFLEVNRKLKSGLGEWVSETYLGQEPHKGGMVVHKWRADFRKGSLKLVLVLDAQDKVTGLWFR